MRNAALSILLAATLVLPLAGCGSGIDEDFQAANRLIVTSLTDADGNAVPVFNAVVKTDDSGKDGDATQEDPDGSQGDGFPDVPGEEILEPLSDDLGALSLSNEPRLGVDPGVALTVYRVDVSYFDLSGDARAFAPRVSYDVNVVVPSGGTADLTFVLVPVDMKANGLQDIFLLGTDEQVADVRQWTAVVDVYARDDLNDDDVHAQARTTVRFINPMVESEAQ